MTCDVFASSASGLAYELGFDDLGCQAKPHQDEDDAVGQVEFPPAMPDRGCGGVVVMVVVPAFAQGHHAHEPVVPAAFAGVIIAIAEEVGQGIDRPRYMPAQHRSYHSPPDEQAQAELEGSHRCAGREPSDEGTAEG